MPRATSKRSITGFWLAVRGRSGRQPGSDTAGAGGQTCQPNAASSGFHCDRSRAFSTTRFWAVSDSPPDCRRSTALAQAPLPSPRPELAR